MAKSLGAAKFRVKNEPQNSPAELARPYGTPVAEIGNRTRKVGLGLAPSASDRAAAKRAAARRN